MSILVAYYSRTEVTKKLAEAIAAETGADIEEIVSKVKYDGKLYYIFGRRSSGYFDIRTLSGEKVNNGSVSYKKINLVETCRNVLTERRSRFPSHEVVNLQTA